MDVQNVGSSNGMPDSNDIRDLNVEKLPVNDMKLTSTSSASLPKVAEFPRMEKLSLTTRSLILRRLKLEQDIELLKSSTNIRERSVRSKSCKSCTTDLGRPSRKKVEI